MAAAGWGKISSGERRTHRKGYRVRTEQRIFLQGCDAFERRWGEATRGGAFEEDAAPGVRKKRDPHGSEMTWRSKERDARRGERCGWRSCGSACGEAVSGLGVVG
ncbi:hypothetical protein PR202_gb13232 [Eleusine coracana subsp. coracana]|uniref:Uncharacterized protein n=1 Tax=Eleusine coracana subsp. coracana TaxID=191504 RepID=A0AAV5EPQ2_ELECO|nr:hypothetical protein PR202_gb13232 [Eleusine coracana subsp. coracana]